VTQSCLGRSGSLQIILATQDFKVLCELHHTPELVHPTKGSVWKNTEMEIEFHYLNRWLQGFRKGCNAMWETISGGAFTVVVESLDKWHESYISVQKQYIPKDIFNMDRRVLFYSTQPNRVFVFMYKSLRVEIMPLFWPQAAGHSYSYRYICCQLIVIASYCYCNWELFVHITRYGSRDLWQ
jgi:hypothetical protein